MVTTYPTHTHSPSSHPHTCTPSHTPHSRSLFTHTHILIYTPPPPHTQTLQVTCYDWDSDGSHDLIGVFTTSLAEMTTAGGGKMSWPCINPKKTHKKKYKDSGTVTMDIIKVSVQDVECILCVGYLVVAWLHSLSLLRKITRCRITEKWVGPGTRLIQSLAMYVH